GLRRVEQVQVPAEVDDVTDAPQTGEPAGVPGGGGVPAGVPGGLDGGGSPGGVGRAGGTLVAGVLHVRRWVQRQVDQAEDPGGQGVGRAVDGVGEHTDHDLIGGVDVGAGD